MNKIKYMGVSGEQDQVHGSGEQDQVHGNEW